jgi:hypothetical protein
MGMLADIVSIIQTGGYGTAGTDLFYSNMPDNPDLCTCLYQYQGRPAGRNPRMETPGLQVRVRGATDGYAAAETKIYNIFKLLHGKNSFTVGANKYKSIDAAGSVMNMGTDEKGRPMLSCNFYIKKDI